MKSPFHTLHTARLLLRPFTSADLHHVFQGLSHPDVIRYYGVSFNSLEDTQEQMKWFNELERNGTGRWWAICAADGSSFYGACGLNNLSAEHKKAEIGFWLLPEHWNKGIMTEALPAVIHYGFSTLGLHRIEALVESGNKSSVNVLEKMNFLYEGTMRDCEIKNGKFISLEIYARINQKEL
jgi:[ribosomal protein S5]-alanine N-acetyltransferase